MQPAIENRHPTPPTPPNRAPGYTQRHQRSPPRADLPFGIDSALETGGNQRQRREGKSSSRAAGR
eukprot:3669307-Karenia_brevis.AAC.1